MPIISPPVASTPIGTISPYTASSAPSSQWLLCDGSAVSRSTYSALFALVSTTYGAGDGSTTFNLPDLRGRKIVGVGTHSDVSTLGNNDGAALGDRRPKHKHTINESAHGHTINDPGHAHINSTARSTTDAQGGSGGVSPLNVNDQTTTAATTGISINSGTTGITAGPQTNVPTDSAAYLVLQYIIKAL